MAASMENLETADDFGYEVRIIDGKKGKGLFALRKIAAGDVIFEERPLVCCQFLWNEAYGYLSCNHCMRPLESAEENAKRLAAIPHITLPYEECCNTSKQLQVKCPHCDVMYCSSECQEESWDHYHRTLCMGQFEKDSNHPLEVLKDSWRQIHYPPETASIMLVARMIASVKQAKDKEGAIALFRQFCHRTVNEDEEIAHKLLGPQFQSQLENLRQLITKALYEEDLHQWFTPEGFRSLVALVGTNGQGVGTSALSAWVRNCDALDLPDDERVNLDKFIDNLYVDIEKESGGFLNNEGSALYPLQSSCNHSCIPNAEPSFPYNNFTLTMTAEKDIEPGEEICVCYLDECTRSRSRHSRIKVLRDNYIFTCTCPLCTEQVNDPDVTSSEDEDEDDDAANGME